MYIVQLFPRCQINKEIIKVQHKGLEIRSLKNLIFGFFILLIVSYVD